MPARYPRPTAPQEGVDRVIALYKRDYNKDLTDEEARTFLEGMMQFVYLTQIHDQLHEKGIKFPKNPHEES